jgi:hypothetical protein
VKIAIILLFETDAQGLMVKVATSSRLADDRTKTRNEQNLDFPDFVHGFSCSGNKTSLLCYPELLPFLV